jgi:hypothetical protein
MTKDQLFGALREILTLGTTALLAYGIGTEGLWQEIAGGVTTFGLLIWGFRANEGPEALLTIMRKLLTSIGGIMIAVNIISPEKANVIVPLLTTIVSVVWSIFFKGAKPPSAAVLILLSLVPFLASCGLRLTDDGCLLGAITRGNSTYYIGPCVGPDADGDGNADVDRVKAEWANNSGQNLRATYWLSKKPVLVEYQFQPGVWLQWSSKSGVVIYPLPPEIEKALDGKPEPVEKPAILPFPVADPLS